MVYKTYKERKQIVVEYQMRVLGWGQQFWELDRNMYVSKMGILRFRKFK